MDHSSISSLILTKDEFGALKLLRRKGRAKLDYELVRSLVEKDLINQIPTGYGDFGIPTTDGSCELADAGIRYLTHLNSRSADLRRFWITWGVTTFIAVLALILSAIAIAAQLELISLPPLK